MGTELASLEAVHQRPWSTVWRVRASDGAVYWAKQNCPHQAFEAALLVVLDRIAPDRVVPVVAADAERGLHLVPDQGPVFAETVPAYDIAAWCRVVAGSMHLQRELAGHEGELVAAGLVPLRPSDAVDYVVTRAQQLCGLDAADPRRLDSQAAREVVGLSPRIVEWAERLGALGLGDSLVHNDLHANNVFATAAGMRFFDFGDAVLAHPLTALFIPVNMLAHRLEAGPDDPRLHRVVDAGLEVWSDVASPVELRLAVGDALRLGRLGRAESWLRVVATMTPSELAEYGDAAAYWLLALRNDPPLA